MIPERLGPICDVFSEYADEMRRNSATPRVIEPGSVYQESNTKNRVIIDRILDELLLPGSGVLHTDHLESLREKLNAGESCLILPEHYSNFDTPSLHYLFSKAGFPDLAESIIFMAGMKLTEESGFVNAFAEAYTRIVIYPSRSLRKISDADTLQQETRRSREINMAATRTMIRMKHKGRSILVFPSGTRYREGDPETKRGVKEVDSYIKSFDWMVTIGIAGNALPINTTAGGDMSMDIATRDVVIQSVSAPISCRRFREAARASCPASTDPKQHVADLVMAELEKVHVEAAEERAARVAAATDS
jgi:glycerol-3-phosphate O-acyltransferase